MKKSSRVHPLCCALICILFFNFQAAPAYDANLDASSIAGDYDLIIRNGHIIDGTGNPWFAADVAVNGDRIVAIGDLREAHAKREIDAKGRIVSPGFIDMLPVRNLSPHR